MEALSWQGVAGPLALGTKAPCADAGGSAEERTEDWLCLWEEDPSTPC